MPFDAGWREAVRRVMEEFTTTTPGSYIEEKESTLAWHYRNVEPHVGEAVANRLAEALAGILSGTTAVVVRGKKVIEVKPAGVNKGAAARYLAEKTAADFILAAGDDATDEDVFKALGPDAYTIKVGRGETSAKFRVSTCRKLREVLAKLTSLQ